MGHFTVRLDDELLEQLRMRAKTRGVSVSEVVRDALFEVRNAIRDDEVFDQTVIRLSAVEDASESHERRLSRLEEMAGL